MTSAAHERAEELLPWLVNGSLQGNDVTWLHSHLGECAQCREELLRQQRLRDAVARQPVVELAPQTSFKRLWNRIEAQAESPATTAGAVQPAMPAIRDRWLWRRAAAMAAGMAAVLAASGLVLWQGWNTPAGNRYRTVASAASPVLAGQIRVVFADTATVADIKGILATVHLEATGGPSPAGVFTLQRAATAADLDVDAVVRSLRADPRVRFAELR